MAQKLTSVPASQVLTLWGTPSDPDNEAFHQAVPLTELPAIGTPVCGEGPDEGEEMVLLPLAAIQAEDDDDAGARLAQTA